MKRGKMEGEGKKRERGKNKKEKKIRRKKKTSPNMGLEPVTSYSIAHVTSMELPTQGGIAQISIS